MFLGLAERAGPHNRISKSKVCQTYYFPFDSLIKLCPINLWGDGKKMRESWHFRMSAQRFALQLVGLGLGRLGQLGAEGNRCEYILVAFSWLGKIVISIRWISCCLFVFAFDCLVHRNAFSDDHAHLATPARWFLRLVSWCVKTFACWFVIPSPVELNTCDQIKTTQTQSFVVLTGGPGIRTRAIRLW